VSQDEEDEGVAMCYLHVLPKAALSLNNNGNKQNKWWGGSSSGGKSGFLATGRLLVRSPGSA